MPLHAVVVFHARISAKTLLQLIKNEMAGLISLHRAPAAFIWRLLLWPELRLATATCGNWPMWDSLPEWNCLTNTPFVTYSTWAVGVQFGQLSMKIGQRDTELWTLSQGPATRSTGQFRDDWTFIWAVLLKNTLRTDLEPWSSGSRFGCLWRSTVLNFEVLQPFDLCISDRPRATYSM